MNLFFWLGASAEADRVLSPSATEPKVSAHSGDAPSRIRVCWNHIDGPLMTRSDGSLKWLSIRERFMHWIGKWSLEKIAERRAGMDKLVYYPPADIWLTLPASEKSTSDYEREARS